jgi:uncharacterized membrane protein YbhN (UPF0104 family)
MIDRLNFLELFSVYVLFFLLTAATAGSVILLIKSFKINTNVVKMFFLHNAVMLLNYAPMKLGTLFRANYLKNHYSLSYTNFAAFSFYITFLMTGVSCVTASLCLILYYPINTLPAIVMCVILVITSLISFLLLFFPVPEFAGKLKNVKLLGNLLLARSAMSSDFKILLYTMISLAASFGLIAIRLYIIYHSLGIKVDFAGCLILGAMTFVTLFVSFTPGSLGIQEAVLSFGAVVLNVPFEQGVLVAMIDRAIIMSYLFTAGLVCTLSLWITDRKDFKTVKNAET